jgi:hypothetical protein
MDPVLDVVGIDEPVIAAGKAAAAVATYQRPLERARDDPALSPGIDDPAAGFQHRHDPGVAKQALAGLRRKTVTELGRPLESVGVDVNHDLGRALVRAAAED